MLNKLIDSIYGATKTSAFIASLALITLALSNADWVLSWLRPWQEFTTGYQEDVEIFVNAVAPRPENLRAALVGVVPTENDPSKIRFRVWYRGAGSGTSYTLKRFHETGEWIAQLLIVHPAVPVGYSPDTFYFFEYESDWLHSSRTVLISAVIIVAVPFLRTIVRFQRAAKTHKFPEALLATIKAPSFAMCLAIAVGVVISGDRVIPLFYRWKHLTAKYDEPEKFNGLKIALNAASPNPANVRVALSYPDLHVWYRGPRSGTSYEFKNCPADKAQSVVQSRSTIPAGYEPLPPKPNDLPRPATTFHYIIYHAPWIGRTALLVTGLMSTILTIWVGFLLLRRWMRQRVRPE